MKILLPLCAMLLVFSTSSAEPTITITLKGDTIMQSQVFQWSEPGWDAKDSANNDYSSSVQVNGTVGNTLGTYYLVYSIPSGVGKADSRVRVVSVVDQIKPLIMLLGSNPLNMIRGQIYNEAGVSVTDNYYPDSILLKRVNIFSDMPKNGDGKYYAKNTGSYFMKYITSDPSENISDTVVRTISVFIIDPGSIEEYKNASDFLLYPNPANDHISVMADKAVDVFNVFDLEGRLILSFENILKTEFKIDVSSLRAGTYFLEGVGQEQTFRRRLVIQR